MEKIVGFLIWDMDLKYLNPFTSTIEEVEVKQLPRRLA
jgi:hypothetical protein